MQQFISFPTIESGLYMFGGHRHTVAGGWHFFEQRHQVFELMTISKGCQLTEIKDGPTIELGPGDAIIIAPETYHTNSNQSAQTPMTYSCLHFDFEDMLVRSRLIGLVANQRIPAGSVLARICTDTLAAIVQLSSNREQVNNFANRVAIEITLLNFLRDVDQEIDRVKDHHRLPYSDKEAKVARDLVVSIENRVNNDDENPSFNFEEICYHLGISSGYGHRVFKKVYGITPLYYINRERYQKAQRLLENSHNSIDEIASLVGAGNISIFSKQFKKWSGTTPSEYRKQTRRKRSVTSKNRTGYFE